MSDGPRVTPGPPKGSTSTRHLVILALVGLTLLTAVVVAVALVIYLRT